MIDSSEEPMKTIPASIKVEYPPTGDYDGRNERVVTFN
jgi:hypothetical protein